MPFSSYVGNILRAGGGNWPQSLLPSSAKPKPVNRKSRKRTTLVNFLFANFFTIALSVSLLFLLLTIFHFGVPKPISFHFARDQSTRYLRSRKPISRFKNATSSGALVDITTKDLYDKIQFLDLDGGPWKQGWRVNYKGDEWDTEKLKVSEV